MRTYQRVRIEGGVYFFTVNSLQPREARLRTGAARVAAFIICALDGAGIVFAELGG